MQKIRPFLWFDGKAEEAARLYTGIFPDAKLGSVMRSSGTGPAPQGAVMSVTFELAGQEYIAFNGGPNFSFTPAVSLFVSCETQAEVDSYWEQLCDGGEPVRCGWLRDRFGLSWQIVPSVLLPMLQDADRERAGRVMQAMMQMVKLDIATLQRAYDGA
jgi:predicted 3-demethylubiquinone-9 3-methyltransferase (glyoxalase superfamily)